MLLKRLEAFQRCFNLHSLRSLRLKGVRGKLAAVTAKRTTVSDCQTPSRGFDVTRARAREGWGVVVDNMGLLYRTAETCLRRADRDAESSMMDKARYVVDTLEPLIRNGLVDELRDVFASIVGNLELDAAEAESRAEAESVRDVIGLVRQIESTVLRRAS